MVVPVSDGSRPEMVPIAMVLGYRFVAWRAEVSEGAERW
ncbi:hypothetical protein CASFOL_028695 [Castilleja foliolosa]|uniref:Uncharacterized protein n=1 Tax=Castilleja foliolosa TaxID=1961234 RepID=A0ABD3CF71_9LAMI